jgi:hypothetical protein
VQQKPPTPVRVKEAEVISQPNHTHALETWQRRLKEAEEQFEIKLVGEHRRHKDAEQELRRELEICKEQLENGQTRIFALQSENNRLTDLIDRIKQGKHGHFRLKRGLKQYDL